MKKHKKYIFDLDNTLIYTNKLNNNAYNYALKKQGMSTIKGLTRITRDLVFASNPTLTTKQKKAIIKLKQAYFIDNIGHTKPNQALLAQLRSHSRQDCILWTSANELRVEALLGYYELNNSFKKVFLSDKSNVQEDIDAICKVWECGLEQIIVYEDDQALIESLRQLGVNVKGIS